MSRPSSPGLAEAAPIAYPLSLVPLEEGAEPTVAPLPQNVSTNASRYVMPLFRNGNEISGAANEASMAKGPMRPHYSSRQTAPAPPGINRPNLPRASYFPSLIDLPEFPYWGEMKRLANLVPSEWFGIAGLVPSAYTNAQNTRFGWRRLLFFWHLQRACSEHRDAFLRADARPWAAEERRRATIEAAAAGRGLTESAFFLSFNLVEHVSFFLAATPLTLNLLGVSRGVARASLALKRATPALLGLHAGLHLLRHVHALVHVGRAQRATAEAQSACPGAAADVAARLSALWARSRREQQVRCVWSAAWLAFEVGLGVSAGLISSAAATPLWAGALLGASIAATKLLEWLFAADVEPPLAVLWPSGTGESPTFYPLRWRAFGHLQDNARAAACIEAQQRIIAEMEAQVWPHVPLAQRLALTLVSGLGPVGVGAWLLDFLSARWLTPYVGAATHPVMQAHKRFWQQQRTLVGAERQRRSDAPLTEGAPSAAAVALSGARQDAPLGPLLRAATAADEAPITLKAQALGILLCRPRQALREVHRALDWGGQMALATDGS